MQRTIKNEEPVYTGIAGKAWVMDMAAYMVKHPDSDARATLKSWIVNCPSAHPLWDNYMIALITLKDIPGIKPAQIRMQDATHEIIVGAIHSYRVPTIDDSVSCLSPMNYTGQFSIKNDDAAIERLDQTIRLICDGRLNPDTDAVGQWNRLFPQS
jgi:hypothetical protein